jgi:hypothetical protein
VHHFCKFGGSALSSHLALSLSQSTQDNGRIGSREALDEGQRVRSTLEVFFSLDVANISSPFCRAFTSIECWKALLKLRASSDFVPMCMIRGKCACFRANMVEHSGHLPSGSGRATPFPGRRKHFLIRLLRTSSCGVSAAATALSTACSSTILPI